MACPRGTVVVLALLFGIGLIPSAVGADWPQWRGPNRDGTSTETGLLKSWPEGGPRRAWLFGECGMGYGGPAIVGNRLYINGTRDDREVLLALDAASGDEQWSAPIGEIYEEDHGDGPRSTPTIDGDRVYSLGGRGNLICVEAASGKVLWTKSLEDDFGGDIPHWGYCESPLIHQNMLLCTPGGKRGSIIALNKLTGEPVWRSTDVTSGAHYASIVIMNHAGHDEAVQLLPDQLVGVDAEAGKLLWSVPWTRPPAAIPTPLVRDNYVFASSGYGTGCVLVELGEDHAVKKLYDNKVMKNKQGGVVLVGEHLYGHSEGVGWVCQEFESGEMVWRDRAVMGMGSVVLVDGLMYCVDEDDGTVALVEPSPERWKERGRFTLKPQSELRSDRGKVWTHPVVANGRLYLRDQNLVYCYDIRDSNLARGPAN